VTHDWFATTGVRLIRGRVFTAQDDERTGPVVIVSKRMADRLWPGQDPINKRIRSTRPNAPWMSTFGSNNLHVMVRSGLPPDALGTAVRTAVHTVDPRLPVPIPTPMTALWDAGLEQQHLAASASALFGVSGLLLAVIGTYGVLAYAVSARAREFGIRLALGAARRDVLLDVMRQGAGLAAIGIAIGGVVGVFANRALSVVATESPGTPVPLVAAMLAVLSGCAVIASLVPAWRATRIDPADVMRTE
jgi:predicted lysophospholipase L1 biosynthesis ABC-type transport system permease subunit